MRVAGFVLLLAGVFTVMSVGLRYLPTFLGALWLMVGDEHPPVQRGQGWPPKLRTAGTARFIVMAALLACSCSRTRRITEQVAWSGEQIRHLRPLPVGGVRFNFISDPDQYVVVTDVPWLLDRLRASGTNTATARF